MDTVSGSRTNLLEFVSTVKVSATTSKFVAKEKFKLKKDEGICSCIGDNFKRWFLSGDGKIEDLRGEQTLRYGNLTKDLVAKKILEELGGKAEITLSEMFDQLSKQSKDEDELILINSYATICYVCDQQGVLRLVSMCLLDGGWCVGADSTNDLYLWGRSTQVLSRI